MQQRTSSVLHGDNQYQAIGVNWKGDCDPKKYVPSCLLFLLVLRRHALQPHLGWILLAKLEVCSPPLTWLESCRRLWLESSDFLFKSLARFQCRLVGVGRRLVHEYARAHTHYRKASICRRRCKRQCSEKTRLLSHMPRGDERGWQEVKPWASLLD